MSCMWAYISIFTCEIVFMHWGEFHLLRRQQSLWSFFQSFDLRPRENDYSDTKSTHTQCFARVMQEAFLVRVSFHICGWKWTGSPSFSPAPRYRDRRRRHLLTFTQPHLDSSSAPRQHPATLRPSHHRCQRSKVALRRAEQPGRSCVRPRCLSFHNLGAHKTGLPVKSLFI